MLAFIRARPPYRDEDIPDGIFPKRQIVGTSITTATQVVSTVTETASVFVSMSVPDVISSIEAIITSTPVVVPVTSTDITTSTTTTAQATPTTTAQAAPSTTSAQTTAAVTTRSSESTTSTTPLAVTSSDVVVVGSTTINRSSLTGATTITSALLGLQTDAVVTTSYYTSNGQVYSTVFTTNRVVSSTTGYATATIQPALASDNSGSGNSLSPHSQAIIGGVVGGVGGFILLGGLAFVAWRLWGKKKGERLPQDDYYSGHDEIQKADSGDGLERYRQPGRPVQPAMSVNAASNF